MLTPIPLVVETGLFLVALSLKTLFSLPNMKKKLSGFCLLRGEGVFSESVRE